MHRVVLAVLVAVAAVVMLGAPAARADSTSGVLTAASFSPASPATAGSGDNTTVSLSFQYADSSDTAKSLSLIFPPGFLAAPAAVPDTCSSVQLAAGSCPGDSEIGTGQATVNTVIGTQTATVSIYLMPPPDGNSVVGIGVILNANVLGIPITTTTSGSATFITGPGGQPQLQIGLPSLPASVPVPGLGSVAIQLTQLSMVLNAQSNSGKQFIYLPTNCSTATADVAVTTEENATGAATASFTPTGCPLAYNGGSVSAAAQVVDTSFDAAFQTAVTFPSGANTGKVVITIPSTALRANPLYAGLNCSTAAPFSGCTKIGTVTASTPLLITPLSGTAYLTGSVSTGFGLGLSFPAPFNIALSGTVDSAGGTTVVTFPSVPDLPLSSLQLALTGSSSSAFQASCGAGTQTLTAQLTGNGGSGTRSTTTALNVAGCPSVGANGGGSQVADYGSGRTPGTKRKVPARISSAAVTNIASGRPALTLTVKAGSTKLTSLKLALPAGLSFVRARLARALHTTAGATHRLSTGALILRPRAATGTLTVRIAAGGLKTSAALARNVRRRRTTKLTFRVLATSVGPTTKLLSTKLNALRR